MTQLSSLKEQVKEQAKGQDLRTFRGYLAEPYDGIGQYVMVTLSRASTSSAFKAKLAAGDAGTRKPFPAGTPVVVFSERGQLEVLTLGSRPTPVAQAVMIFDGGGAVLTTGVKGWIPIHFECTITEWVLLGDLAGALVIDVWKDTMDNFPPTVADTITGGAKPTIASGSLKGNNDFLPEWSPNLLPGDVLMFNIDSISTIKMATLTLKLMAPPS